MLSNGVLYVLILNRFYNVTSLVLSYIVITVFSRPSFRAIVSALWCLLVLFHHVRICSSIVM